MEITVCSTAYQESENLKEFLNNFDWIASRTSIPLKLCIVNNGSTDDSMSILATAEMDLVKVVNLQENARYGGGFKTAIKESKAPVVCLIPADNQYPKEEILGLIEFFANMETESQELCMVKGIRIERRDPMPIKILSNIYRFLVNFICGFRLKDINGQPKVFSAKNLASRIDMLPDDASFDAALNFIWHSNSGYFLEIPVRYLDREYGKPSWHTGKLKTSIGMLNSLLRFRLVVTKA